MLTVGEIERGIERQRQLNPEFAERIASWLDMILTLIPAYSANQRADQC